MTPFQIVNMFLGIEVILELIKKEFEKSMPSHSGIFVLSYSRRIMNKFILNIERFYSNEVYYHDTDSLYIHMDHYEKLKEAGFVGNKLGQGKND